MLTFDQIKELIDLVGDRGLEGLEIERSGFRLKIDGQKRTVASAEVVAVTEAPAAAPTVPVPAAPAVAPAAEGDADEGPVVPADATLITSPIVGTFYRAPSPEAELFVQVGSRVIEGQVLCIIEAMKLMNEIESDFSGEIVAIYPENAQPVEYGEPLFAIKKG